MVGCIAVRKLFTALNAPVYLKDADVRTATIVLPKWNDPVPDARNKTTPDPQSADW